MSNTIHGVSLSEHAAGYIYITPANLFTISETARKIATKDILTGLSMLHHL
ncbi:hypothetical protein [Flavobacterium johnsoniae]|uniref:hypothetical protein n=1 Tax=Flavobacterium johnsoniae TaxID=986 RepID=UPI003D96FEEF